jgi:glycosyltransferase involved in cell wall biosynthesis
LPGRRLKRTLDEWQPDALHIATEGPVGQAGRRWARSRGVPFTTSYHTQFPQYLHTYFGMPQELTYGFLRWFHGPAQRTLVPTESMRRELIAHGFDTERIVTWTRGVNQDRFRVRDDDAEQPLAHLPKPIFLYCGRVAPEKNLDAFLQLDLPGSKVIVGDGPATAELRQRFPDAVFTGFKTGDDLARHVAGADVFVFPSRTDTFGVVMLEAMACGLPVAAFPVTGPVDVIGPKQGEVGWLSEDLRAACLHCLELDPAACRRYAEQFTWARCARMVADHLAPIRAQPVAVAPA